jgi:hypothetical protein
MDHLTQAEHQVGVGVGAVATDVDGVPLGVGVPAVVAVGEVAVGDAVGATPVDSIVG